MEREYCCTNPDCKNPQRFRFTELRPISVTLVHCAACGAHYRYIFRGDWSDTFERYSPVLELQAEEPAS